MSWRWTAETLRRLSVFLSDKDLLAGRLTTRRIGDGHSNLTFLVSDGHRQVIVRRPPPPPSPPGAHDVLREATFLTALQETTVPVPRVLATAEAGEVLDVALYVMSYVAGPVVTTTTPAPLDSPTARAEIGASLVDTMVGLHSVDWQSTALADSGRPDGFNGRHLARLARLVTGDNVALPQRFSRVHSWLVTNVPAESGASIIHCDFRLGNVVLAANRPGRVAAVLDWELATIGDPLIDLGYFLATVPEAGRPANPTAELGLAMCEEGYPTRSQLADRYARATGRDLSDLSWYTTLALWKLAVLYDYSARRAASGQGDPYYNDPRLVPAFLQEAHEAIGKATEECR
jgi:aminoglycoside phosphotransferase (APT) family kinase protein